MICNGDRTHAAEEAVGLIEKGMSIVQSERLLHPGAHHLAVETIRG